MIMYQILNYSELFWTNRCGLLIYDILHLYPLQWTSPSMPSMDVSIAAFQRCSLFSSSLCFLISLLLLWLPARLFCFLRVRLLLRFIHTQNNVMLLSTCYSSGVCSSESVTLVVLPEWPAPSPGRGFECRLIVICLCNRKKNISKISICFSKKNDEKTTKKQRKTTKNVQRKTSKTKTKIILKKSKMNPKSTKEKQ